jgi:hypothetical protein
MEHRIDGLAEFRMFMFIGAACVRLEVFDASSLADNSHSFAISHILDVLFLVFLQGIYYVEPKHAKGWRSPHLVGLVTP